MNFVYICRSGENEELRYSIRSVNYHYPEAKIWVVGDFPSWYDGDYVRVKQTETKYRNALKNLTAIVNSPQIPENFILMNDDFYIIDKPNSLEYWHEGPLIEKYYMYYDYYQSSSYTRKLFETNSRLKRLGYKEAVSYELHVPFPVEKSKLARVLKYEDLLWRSMYGNIFEVGGHKISDVKFYHEVKMNFKNYDYKNPHSSFLSTDDSSFEKIKKEILSKKFSKKTKYEKWVIPKTKS
jgi:hypothetical protein